MRNPKMILFDYGQTLVNEAKFDGIRGTEAVMRYATRNEHQLTAKEIQDRANQINQELGRFDPARRHLFQIEVPNHMFTRYLYESLGIEFSNISYAGKVVEERINSVIPEDVWFVGDQYECDIVGAGNAGMFPIWYLGAIDLPYTEHEGVLTVKSWEELMDRMQLMNRRQY